VARTGERGELHDDLLGLLTAARPKGEQPCEVTGEFVSHAGSNDGKRSKGGED
jgi:hypothetical protein